MSVLNFPNNVPLSYPSVYDKANEIPNFEESSQTLDLRTSTDTIKFYVTFLARGLSLALKSPGHLFINWGYENDKSKMSIEEFTFGFYATSTNIAKMILGTKGELKDEIKENEFNYKYLPLKKLIVIIDKNVYDKTVKIKEIWDSNPPEYRLFTNNCMSFTIEIAKTLNLNTPKNSFNDDDIIRFPWLFIDDLINLNKMSIKK